MRAICILGKNPGPLTRSGTNTWLLPGAEPTLIDAAEDTDEYAQRVADALEAAQPGAALARLLVTHAHGDHISGAAAIRRRWPNVVCAKLPDLTRDPKYDVPFEALRDEDVVRAGDGALWAIHTPGHAPDHVCYYEPRTAVLFCGDLIVNGGTVTIPVSSGGNLRQYLRSLRRILELQPRQAMPGHGDTIDNPGALIRAYLGHRQLREQQIVDVLESGPATIDQITARVYTGLAPDLVAAAAENVHAHLLKLLEEGRAARSGDGDGDAAAAVWNAV
jgi:glyoxylase-like metal-dependent hydrolase (beta-lactamase superfamily II)